MPCNSSTIYRDLDNRDGNISDDMKIGFDHEMLVYKPHPVVTRLKESFHHENRIRPSKKINNSITIVEPVADSQGEDGKITIENEPFTLFSNIVEKLDQYYEEKMKIEMEKLKLHFEKEMVKKSNHHIQNVNHCSCSCSGGKEEALSLEMEMVLKSINQVNLSLQKRNEELTNHLVTILLHIRNEQLNSVSNNESLIKPSTFPTTKNGQRKKSLFCNIM